MAVIAIILGCLIGALAGTAHVVFLDAPVWQGVLTYILTAAALTFATLTTVALRQPSTRDGSAAQRTLAEWREWQADEDFMEAAEDAEDPFENGQETRIRASR